MSGHGPGAPPVPLHPTVKAAVPRSTMVTSMALAWLESLALTVALVAAGRAVDRLLDGASPAFWVTALAVAAGLAASAQSLATLHTARARMRTEEVLRAAVLDSILAAGVRDASDRSGALVQAATDSVERAARYRAGFLGPIVGTFTTPFLVLAVLAASVSWRVAGVLALVLLAVPFLVRGAQSAAGDAGARNRAERTQLAADFLVNLQGLGTLVAHGAAGRAERRLAEQGERHRRSLMKVLAANQLTVLAMDAAVTLALLLASVLLGVHGLGAGTLTVGEALAVVLVTLVAIRPVDSVGQFFYIGIGGRASQAVISRQLARADRVTEGAPTRALPADGSATPGPAISLQGVHAGWTAERDVLSDFSLTVAPGERVALVGPSGVGKSTVSALLQGHLEARSGEVRLHGEDVGGGPTSRLLSVVEQRTFLFQQSLAENLRLAAPDASDEQLWHALTSAGLADEVRAMPAGLETLVGEHGLSLSGGQSQRVAIARAVLRDAPVLLLDEPTSQVDLAGEAAFLDRLDALARGRSVLMIAHRPGAILAADRTVALDVPPRAPRPAQQPALIQEASR